LSDQEQSGPPSQPPATGPAAGAQPPVPSHEPTGAAPPPPPPPAPPESGTPGPPTPPPPAPPGGGTPEPPSLEPLPWEDRGRIGVLNAFGQTARLFTSRPRIAFDRARRMGDYGSPLIWVVFMGLIAALVNWLYGIMFLAPLTALLPGSMRDEMAPMMAFGVMSSAFKVVLYPIMIVIGTFIGAAITHLCLLLVGGSRSNAGYEATFRAVAYSEWSQIAYLIPFVGGLVAAVWSVILLVIGISSMHKLSTGTAVIVVLIPMILCCTCLALAAFVIFSMAGMSRTFGS
jgi:hypothetical protein